MADEIFDEEEGDFPLDWGEDDDDDFYDEDLAGVSADNASEGYSASGREGEEEEEGLFSHYDEEDSDEVDYYEDVEDIEDAGSLGEDEDLSFDEVTSEPSQSVEDLTNMAFTVEKTEVPLHDIAFSAPLKNSRKDTYKGLTTSVEQLGILDPVTLVKTQGYSEWLDEMGEDPNEIYGGIKYICLDGFRRLYAAARNQIEDVPAIIYTFADPETASNLYIPFSLHINRSQKRSPGEVWSLIELLEEQHSLSPANLEFLLELAPGDAMKLKDVMKSEYPEIIDDLLIEKKTISQAYNALQKARKEEDRLALDDEAGIENAEGAEEIVESGGERLDEETVKELLELKDMDIDLDQDDFSQMIEGGELPDLQKSGERRPIDPALRNAVFKRDNFRCQICGTGGPAFLGALVAHHILPVSLRGPDTMDNLATLCDSDHLSLHWIADRKGKIYATKEEFDEYTDEEKLRIKKVRRFSEVIIAARKKLGRLDEKEHPGHRMPGVGVKGIEEAYNQSGRPVGAVKEEQELVDEDE